MTEIAVPTVLGQDPADLGPCVRCGRPARWFDSASPEPAPLCTEHALKAGWIR